MHIWMLMLLFCSLGIKESFGAVEDCRIADIAFVLDSSTSIYILDFNKSKNFVESIIRNLNVGPDATHIAALTYGHEVKTEFTFNDYRDADKEKIANRIAQITHIRGEQTFTHEALTVTTNELFSESNGARPDVPHICVIVTDGKSTYGEPTLEAAERAKQNGITIIAIGVGNKVDENEIMSIASEPKKDNAIFTNSYSELINATFQDAVIDKTCEVTKTTTEAPPTTTTQKKTTTTEEETTTTKTTEKMTTTKPPTTTTMIKDKPEECQGKEVDVLFVLDMSTSIWDVDFTSQLEFVSDVVSNFDIESGKTRVGLITFSDNPVLGFDFNTYTDGQDTMDAVKKVKKEGGITNTHLALNATLEMFTPAHGSRPGVAHIAIVITDGISRIPKETIAAAGKVHDKGIYVFSIGVGNMTDKAELEMMATDPSYSYEVEGYSALEKIKEILAYKTCKVPGDQSTCLKDASAQIMFGMFNIGGDQRLGVSELIKHVTGGFKLDSGKVSVGIDEVCTSVQLDKTTYESNDEFYGEMSAALKNEMSGMVKRIRDTFMKKSPKGKKIHVTVLLVSGKADDSKAAEGEIKRLSYKSDVIVVNVGKGSSFEGLSENSRLKVFSVLDSDDYPYVRKRILSFLCDGL